MDSNNHKFDFSKMLIQSAINLMEEINQTDNEEEQILLLNAYSGITESMEFIIEQYISEKDKTNRELFLDELRDKVNKFEPKRLETSNKELESIIKFRGKDLPKA